jgi:hypothetical protein
MEAEMKLIYTQGEKRLKKLVHDWLISRTGEVLSGIKARSLFQDLYGIDIDHHEYISVLDEMSRRGECTVIQGWGDTTYLIGVHK